MKNIILLFAILLLTTCTEKNRRATKDKKLPTGYSEVNMAKKPQNIIFLIGDGMGLGQITAGMYMNNNRLNLEDFPVVGLHKCHASSHLVTDSAAGATALSCGVKTYNGAIGVNADTLAIQTILEEADERGLATGMVSTSTIVHATPASFIAHQKARKMYEAIAADFLETDIDIFIGGGRKYFAERKTDDRNLYEELEAKGYVIKDYFSDNLQDITLPEKENFGFLTSLEDPIPVASGRDYLPLASKIAVQFLDKRSANGFYLMIEGSQIDWGGHANNSDYIITEMLEFDKVIGDVLAFAKRDGNTLVVVTADHETGGYSILKDSKMGDLKTAFTTDYHTASMIPVFAYGPGAENFAGIYENTEIYHKMRKLMGFDF